MDNDIPWDLPRYKCHKEVYAAKIREIDSVDADGKVKLYLFGARPVEVTPAWIEKHGAKAGGYLVVYGDGYRSWSPAKAFEEGYTRIS